MQNEMNQIDRMPKKNPLSFQIDLSKFEKATDEEKKQQDVMSESASFFKDGMRKLMKNPLAVGSIFVLVAIVLMIVIVPRVVPYGYSDIVTINGVRDTAAQNMAPLQWSEMEQAYIDDGGSLFPHIMGTDEMGRDYFVRVVYGTKVSLIVGIFAALLVLIIGVVYGGVTDRTDRTPVPSFDLARYMGTWYEIARYDHPFERGLAGVQARYELRPDGRIGVFNSGTDYRSGRCKRARGKACAGQVPGRLRVSFFWVFYSDYNVMELGGDYDWALVGGGSAKYLWVLSRTPTLPAHTLNRILRLAERRGYRTDRLLFVDQGQ